MHKLTHVRDALTALGQRRLRLRRLIWLSSALLALLAALAVLFAIDWLFEPRSPSRVLLLVVTLTAWGELVRRSYHTWLGHHPSTLELALDVERAQAATAPSDLVAALEFDAASPRPSESRQLREALVAQVAQQQPNCELPDAAWPTARRRLTGAALATLASLLLVGTHLDVAQTLLGRLMLRELHYPRQTHLDALHVAGESLVLPQSRTLEQAAWAVPLRVPFGSEVVFEVLVSGAIPQAAELELSSTSSPLVNTIMLQPVPPEESAEPASAKTPSAPVSSANAPGDAVRRVRFAGKLPRLVHELNFTIVAGDTRSPTFTLQPIELPVATVQLQATPPDYARRREGAVEGSSSARQLSVLEGSRVDLWLTCTNKQLREAWLQIDQERYALQRAVAGPGAAMDSGAAAATPSRPSRGELWYLPTAETPLANLTQQLRYSIEATDVDGLQLPEPIRGIIHVHADQPPSVAAQIVTHYVLPGGRPTITYTIRDDYGVASLRLVQQIIRSDGSVEDAQREIPLAQVTAEQITGELSLDLVPLRLAKGDVLKLTFAARDHRGTDEPRETLAEPLVLHVTDERGVLEAIAETDQRTARQLDAIIERQLGLKDPLLPTTSPPKTTPPLTTPPAEGQP